MEQWIDVSLLLSFYHPLLTKRQQEMLRYYYEEDLSLSEIAELCKVSRQGAHDAIRRGVKQLMLLEEKLCFRARWVQICEQLTLCNTLLENGETQKAQLLVKTMLEEQQGAL